VVEEEEESSRWSTYRWSHFVKITITV